ncbi:MAG: hypothetical protein KF770_22925 [Anaerolineae bacterium]|nr:hypothetical protein [Anaerolineae bacterium]
MKIKRGAMVWVKGNRASKLGLILSPVGFHGKVHVRVAGHAEPLHIHVSRLVPVKNVQTYEAMYSYVRLPQSVNYTRQAEWDAMFESREGGW